MVFDSGPLIYLDTLGYLPVLTEMYRVFIPDAVAEELTRRPGAAGSGAPFLESAERRTPTAQDLSLVASGPPAIDPGEREVIAFALGDLPGSTSGVTVAMDDRRGRRRAALLGIPVIGTLAILVRIHHLGHARQSFSGDLDLLEEAGMYITEDLKRHVTDRFNIT